MTCMANEHIGAKYCTHNLNSCCGSKSKNAHMTSVSIEKFETEKILTESVFGAAECVKIHLKRAPLM